MTYDKLLRIFESWGLFLKTEHYYDFKFYCQEMLKRKRMVIVTNDGQVTAVLFFFITNDYSKLYKKGEFETPEDLEEGSQIYIDKLICSKWERNCREVVRDLLEKRFPTAKEAVYHRAPKDRCVIIRRRTQNVPSESVV